MLGADGHAISLHKEAGHMKVGLNYNFTYLDFIVTLLKIPLFLGPPCPLKGYERAVPLQGKGQGLSLQRQGIREAKKLIFQIISSSPFIISMFY